MRRLASFQLHRTFLVRAMTIVAALAIMLAAAPGVLADDVYSEETLRIARKLQCPVCQGQTVADSTSQLAAQMRDVIEEKVQAGESEAQIIDFFVARYGQGVVTEPPKEGFTLALWWMPVVVVVLGAAVVTLFIRERTRRSAVPSRTSADAAVVDEELEAIARDVLGSPPTERTSGA